MKRVLQINVVANCLSTGRITEGIGLQAQANGFESYVAYGRFAKPSQNKLLQIGSRKDYLVHGVFSHFFDDHGLRSKTATKLFIQEMDKIQPDVVHLHNIHGYFLNYPLLFDYLREKKIPVVWTLHDCWPFTGHCAYFDYAGCNRWQSGCHDCPQKKTFPASYVFDRSRQNWLDKKRCFTSLDNMVIVPVSHWLGDLVKQSFLGKYPVQTIYNGIDTDVFKPADANIARGKYGWGRDKILLGVASTWSPRKGLADFIELAKILPVGYRIVLVGLSDKQQETLPGNVTGISRTESVRELAELYSAADCFINPTREDNYPTTNLEALSCGTPVITYRTGGSPESLANGVGQVVKAGDIAALWRAIQEMTSLDKSSYFQCCRQHAVANFRQQDRFREYIKLYQTFFPKREVYHV